MLKFNPDRTADDDPDDVTELFTRSPGGGGGGTRLMEWPGKRAVALDVCKAKRIFDAMGAAGVQLTEKVRRERSVMWLEYETKKDTYHEVTGYKFNIYPSMDVKRPEKRALEEMYQAWCGHTWSKHKGWIGRQKRLLGPEIKVLEAEASQFEGVICGYHRKPPKKGFNEDGSVAADGMVVADGDDASSVVSAAPSISTINSLKAQYVKSITEPIAAKLMGIDLTAFGCVGPLPASLKDLVDCESLCLGWNSLYGTIPYDLGQMVHLTHLDVSNNSLQGTLDEVTFASLVKLKCFNLSFNQLSGVVPSFIFAEWKCLIDLNLSGNQFSGPLPSSLSNLTTLEVLRLYGNQFSGSIDPSLSSLQSLRSANLSRNQLTGGLEAFYGCTSLVELQLNHNQLTDHIGPGISQLCELRLLYLNHNPLQGTVPAALVTLHKLRHLNLSHTNLTGPLPDDLGLLDNLETLLVADTHVTGPLPRSVEHLLKLHDFVVNKPFPSQDMHTKRGFAREKFERLHVHLPALGVDTLVWDDDVVHGKIAPLPSYDPANPLNYNSFRTSWQSMLDAGYGL